MGTVEQWPAKTQQVQSTVFMRRTHWDVCCAVFTGERPVRDHLLVAASIFTGLFVYMVLFTRVHHFEGDVCSDVFEINGRENLLWCSPLEKTLQFFKMHFSPVPCFEILASLSQRAAALQPLSHATWAQVWRGCSLLQPWSHTLLFVLLLSVSVSEPPSPLSLLWLGFQLWMLPLTSSVIPQKPTYPCLPPLMCDLMYCLTVPPPPFKINCCFISLKDKTACSEHNSGKVVWIQVQPNN